MNTPGPLRSLRCLVLLAALLGAWPVAHALDPDLDMDARFRARLIKEKSKMNAQETNPALKPRDGSAPILPEGECGSQNIGNVTTGDRPGATPREIFVFAPNAINIVNQRGCGN